MENLGRVVLLMGGVSSEREVSLMSGEGVHKALVSKGVDVLKFDPKTDSLETLEKGGFDRAFIALQLLLRRAGGRLGGHGAYGRRAPGPRQQPAECAGVVSNRFFGVKKGRGA